MYMKLPKLHMSLQTFNVRSYRISYSLLDTGPPTGENDEDEPEPSSKDDGKKVN